MKLWYVHLEPINFTTKSDIVDHLEALLKGPGQSGMARLMWSAKAISGVADHRNESIAKRRQRPLVFTDRKAALAEAKKHGNEFWKASVREACLVGTFVSGKDAQ